jgi:MOSC domain-containing protein YiiM
MPNQMGEQRGAVERIFLADAHGSQPRPVAVAVAHAGRGLEGDRHFDDGDSCHLSLIEAEAIENMRAEHGLDLPPGDARRQLVVRGVDLGDLIGRRFLVGDVECEGEERCEPCNHLAGLVETPIVLRGLLHSGLRAKILSGGTIRVGDTVQPSALVSKEAKPAI